MIFTVETAVVIVALVSGAICEYLFLRKQKLINENMAKAFVSGFLALGVMAAIVVRIALAGYPIHRIQFPNMALQTTVLIVLFSIVLGILYFIRANALRSAGIGHADVSDRYVFLTSVLYSIYSFGLTAYVGRLLFSLPV